jgi:hypothetical protein
MPGEIWLAECPACPFSAEVETGADACDRCGARLRPHPSLCANHHARSVWTGCHHRSCLGPCERCGAPLLHWKDLVAFAEAAITKQPRPDVPCPACHTPLEVVDLGLWD